MSKSEGISISELKELFAAHLRAADRLKTPEGIPTGIEALDRYLFWKGLPKSALTLFCGELGLGATSPWIEAATHILNAGRWAAWINHEIPLCPLPLQHRGADLNRLVAIEAPESPEKLFWLLQELMSASLFDLIGCDLGKTRLREHQLRKLQAQAREAHVALVCLSQQKPPRGTSAALFSLIVNFKKNQVAIERALHRPTPHSFSRSLSYARFTLHTGDRISIGSSQLASDHTERQPDSLPEPARDANKQL